jgi:hypothetical protein
VDVLHVTARLFDGSPGIESIILSGDFDALLASLISLSRLQFTIKIAKSIKIKY